MYLTFIGFILIFVGLFVILTGLIGFYRFQDFFCRQHAASVIEVTGIPIILIGLVFLQNNYISALKLMLIIICILILNPVSSYMLAKARYSLNDQDIVDHDKL